MKETQPIKNDNARLASAISDKPHYTLADCGCYVDSARGIYAIDAIVAFAESHGAKIKPCEDNDSHVHAETANGSRFAGCEDAGEIEDECDEYMNSAFAVEGATWGRSEQGDWGLWALPCEECDKEFDDNPGKTICASCEAQREPSEPEEGDITTEDHKRFYQYGKLWLELSEDLTREEMNAAIQAQMKQDQFWPNVWFISDHGNAHMVTLS